MSVPPTILTFILHHFFFYLHRKVKKLENLFNTHITYKVNILKSQFIYLNIYNCTASKDIDLHYQLIIPSSFLTL